KGIGQAHTHHGKRGPPTARRRSHAHVRVRSRSGADTAIVSGRYPPRHHAVQPRLTTTADASRASAAELNRGGSRDMRGSETARIPSGKCRAVEVWTKEKRHPGGWR